MKRTLILILIVFLIVLGFYALWRLYVSGRRDRRRFWFIRWGTKAIRQEVTTRNPYRRISYTEYIELRRRCNR